MDLAYKMSEIKREGIEKCISLYPHFNLKIPQIFRESVLCG